MILPLIFSLVFVIKVVNAQSSNSYDSTELLSNKYQLNDLIKYIKTLETFDSFDSSLDFILEDLYPKYWNNVLDLNEDNFQLDENNNFIIDAFNYMDRLTLYKSMLKLTSLESVCSVKHDNSKNILWGLPLQHSWQYVTGRLFSSDNDTTIDVKAWWGDMNYYLSIIPYLGAVKAALLPSISLSNNPNSKNFCDSYDNCSALIDEWSKFFFKYMTYQQYQCDSLNNIPYDNRITSLSTSNFVNTIHSPIANKIDFNLTVEYEDVLISLWNAHTFSISTALPLFQSKLIFLSKKEAEFGLAWSKLVAFIAFTAFPCDIKTTNILQNLLPTRLLQDDDQAPFIDDMTRLQNRAILLIDGLYIADTKSNGEFTYAWELLMCSETTRALGREMIMIGLYRLPVLVEDLKSVITSECVV